MGRTKKFIDKKKSATFQILARDSSDQKYEAGPAGDKTFYRLDNNSYSVNGFDDAGEPNDGASDNNHGGIFDDAPGDYDSDENDFSFGVPDNQAKKKQLPDHIRKEILELGFPDDGYNYLAHLREIKNTGGGSTYYQNPKSQLVQPPRDIKAYDASRIDISKFGDDNDNSNERIYSVAAKTVGVRIQKAVDPEVAALLEDSDFSQFGSDVEDLDEDFVIKANLPEFPFDEQKVEKNLKLVKATDSTEKDDSFKEMPRVRRAIDDQFDMLQLQEYGSEDDGDDYMDDENDCEASLAEKLSHTFKLHSIHNSEVDGNQKVPLDMLRINKKMTDDEEAMEFAPDVINRVREYAEKYENESVDEETVLFDESSSDSEIWDCETVVSTYSNLDNHPGKIEAPGLRRKKKLPTISEVSKLSVPIINLKGKEKLPVDFLPNRGKDASGKSGKKKSAKEEENDKSKVEIYNRKQHGQESKEEKKERKSAVKEEKREARRAKKEMKELYKSEAHSAQKVAAFTGPSGRRLM
ncbi:unnamed protein product [Cuscuta europaea]|uniref:Low temperature viability protein n=1 Tax=Cuscuta europaea TaxID=41803 RepID=A0A9P0YWB1_CUSEU|nr:unnamed protein product [Cuscuta europaea]